MGKPIEVQWEVMCEDETWEDGDEIALPSATPVVPQKKQQIAYTLLLVAALVCLLFISFWTDSARVETPGTLGTVAVSTEAQTAESLRQPPAYPRAPLEYWEEKFFVEEVEGRTYTRTPRQYWEDRFLQQEVEGR